MGALLLLGSSACGGGRPDPGRTPLRIYCAASVSDAVRTLANEFGAEPFTLVPGPSNALARQLADGAPGDLFLTADPGWARWLSEQVDGLEPGVVLAGNRIVCATAPDHALVAAAPANASELAAALGEDLLLGWASEGVPLGDYTREALGAADLAAALGSRAVGLRDASAVLRAVTVGDVDAAFVYRSDLARAEVHELFALPSEDHAPAQVVGLVLPGAEAQVRARALLAELGSPRGRARLVQLGFEAPAPEASPR